MAWFINTLKRIEILQVIEVIILAWFLVFFLVRSAKWRWRKDDPGAELVKWAKTCNHLPNEIIVIHEKDYASNKSQGDYHEQWYIEEKK